MKSTLVEHASLSDRLFGWWYRIGAPAPVSDEAPLRQRMVVRSGRLTSVIFLIEGLNVLVNLLIDIIDAPFAVPSLLILLAAVLVGIILNRFGKTTLAGIIVFVVAEVGLIANFLAQPGGLSPFSMSLFDFFVTGELIAASLTIPWIIFPVTAINCTLIVFMITFLPKTPELIQLLKVGAYNVYADPIVIQVMVSMITFIWVTSTYHEMKRANSAEEVNKLTMAMATQQQQSTEEKEQLEQSIQQIVAVHMQVANGNFDARVPLDQQNVLWSVAGSLNNLLARLQRLRYDSMQVQRNEQAIEQLLNNIQKSRRLGVPVPVYKTGTSLDAVIMEVAKGTPAPQSHNHISEYPSVGD